MTRTRSTMALLVVGLAACGRDAPGPSATAPAAGTPPPPTLGVIASAAPSFAPGTVLALLPLDPDAFAYDVPTPSPPPLNGDGLAALAIAPGRNGWVIGGGYSATFGETSPIPTEDAVMWFSPDGRAWQRVDTAEVFGGDGYQVVDQVAGDLEGWWARGESWTGIGEDAVVERRLWRSEDGMTWRRVDPVADVHALAQAWPDRGSAGVPAAGRSDGDLAFFRMDGEAAVIESAPMPLPPWVEEPETVEVKSITFGIDGWLVLGWEWVPGEGGPEPRALAWTSPSGDTWTPLGEAATSALAGFVPRTVSATRHGWFAVGQSLYRSVDLRSWEPVAEVCCGSAFDAIIEHEALLIALSDEEVRVWTSTDGETWSPVALTDPMFEDDAQSSGARPITGASNGTELILAGRDWPGAAAWLGLTP